MFAARRAIGAVALTLPVRLKIRRQVTADGLQMFMKRLLFVRSFSEQIQIVVCQGFEHHAQEFFIRMRKSETPGKMMDLQIVFLCFSIVFRTSLDAAIFEI